jgi:hypothetical protein
MTVQQQMLSLAQLISPTTKNQQTIQDLTSAVNIASSTNATPIEITTATAHGMRSNDQVYITGHTTNTAANNTATNPAWSITWVSATKFTLNGSVGNGVGGATGTVTGALVGTVNGSSLTRQRMLDVYNGGRMALMRYFQREMPGDERGQSLSGTRILKPDFQFLNGVGNKPTGFVSAIRLSDVSENPVTIISPELIEAFRSKETASNRFVVDYATYFKSISGNTYLTDAATYILWYYGLVYFTLADVIGGTVEETVNPDLGPLVIDIAQAIVRQQSNKDIDAKIKVFLGG